LTNHISRKNTALFFLNVFCCRIGNEQSRPLGRDQGLRPFSVNMIYHDELINMYLGQSKLINMYLGQSKLINMYLGQSKLINMYLGHPI